MIEYTVPIKVRWTPFVRCGECNKRKLTTSLFHVYDNGLNEYIEYNVCIKCQRRAKRRAIKERKVKE